MNCWCIISERDDWFWDCTDHSHVVWIEDIRWKTIRQAICELFNTTSWDIKNSPWLYWICGVEIKDYNQIIDESFEFKHITKRWKKSKNDEFFRPKWYKLEKNWVHYILPELTLEEYTFCSWYFLIVPHNPKE